MVSTLKFTLNELGVLPVQSKSIAGLVKGDDTTVGTANALFTTPSLRLDNESPSKVFVNSGRVENSPLVKQPSEDECSIFQAQ